MFKRLFGTSGGGGGSRPSSSGGGGGIAPQKKNNPMEAVDKLKETIEMLEKREAVLQKKMQAELARAREFNKAKNKRAALQCLKKKKLYEQQAENNVNHQLKLQEQLIMLEGTKATAETFSALKSGSSAMAQMTKETNIDEVDKTMDDLNEQTDKMRQVQEALGQAVGYAADLDEDELDAELAELDAEDLDEDLLEGEAAMPAAAETIPAMPSAPTTAPVIRPSALPNAPKGAAQKSKEDAELEELQAEMELLGA